MKTIVKYANRKLYDRDTSKYTSLYQLLFLPVGSFQVIQYRPDNVIVDITTETLLAALSMSHKEACAESVKVEILKHCVERLTV